MADIADIAADYQAADIAKALASVSRNRNRNVESLTHCIDCGEEIPQARRQAELGCELCVSCKAEEENRGSFWP